jgi:hypothetical protein
MAADMPYKSPSEMSHEGFRGLAPDEQTPFQNSVCIDPFGSLTYANQLIYYADNADNGEPGKQDLEKREEMLDADNQELSSDDIECWNHPKRNIFKIAAAYYGFLIQGMSDSSIGVLLPSLESYYHLSYLVVSLAFLSPFFGYLFAALFGDIMHRRLGRWGVCVLGTSCQLIAFVIAVTRPPFPVFVLAYAIAGLGNGTIDAAWNPWLGSLNNANQIMGILHGFYGIGGIICPAVFTAMIAQGISWNICYAVMISASGLSVTASGLAYCGDTPAKYRERISNGAYNKNSSIKEVVKSKVCMVFFCSSW